MGGAIVMDYLLSQQAEDKGVFDKVLLLAPLVRPAGFLGVRLAHWTLKGFVTSIKRNFKINSHDADFVDFMMHKDPLQAKRIPVQWVTAMLQWQKRFQQLSWSEMEVLIIQGEGDKTVDWQFNLNCIRKKFPQAKQFRIKEARHHLAREDDYYFERVTQAADIYFDRRRELRY
jgi:alpha-beta hydrolase superfamily lysophospholipase